MSPKDQESLATTPHQALASQLRYGLANGQPIVTPGNPRYNYARSITTMSLYSDKGLDIYEEITKLEEYYPFQAELEILKEHGEDIARRMMGERGPDSDNEVPIVDEERDSPEYEEGKGVVQSNQRWGDEAVGSNNQGVNGGLNAGVAKVGLVVELGAGSLSKTRHLLRALAKLLKSDEKDAAPFASIEYKALDLEHKSLVATLTDLLEQEGDVVSIQSEAGKVGVSGLCATYDEGLQYLRSESTSRAATPSAPLSPSVSQLSEEVSSDLETSTASLDPSTTASSLGSAPVHHHQKSLLWLGSSIGNLSRSEAAAFLQGIATNVLVPGDTILIGIDNCDDGAKIEQGYDDPQGVTRRFILEGVNQSGEALGKGGKMLKEENFDYISHWNAEIGRHEAYVKCKVEGLEIVLPAVDDLTEETVILKKDELIAIEVSVKYTDLEAHSIFKAAGLRLIQKWTDSSRVHSLYLVEKAPLDFMTTLPLVQLPSATRNEDINHFGLPSIEDWQKMWKAWDLITLEVVPRSLLFTKPIDLRHMFLFYLGHIPAFADIHLSAHFKEPLTEPVDFARLFERGIDPDVKDPTKISHSHSVIPTKTEDWPTLEEILAYEVKIRERLRLATETKPMTRRLSRVLAVLIEHEAMHLETLLYIAIQASNRLLPAPGYSVPDFTSLSRSWDASVAAEGEARKTILEFEATKITLGLDDDDEDLQGYDEKHVMGWDVEIPSRSIQVAAFRIDALPICNSSYLTFLQSFSTSPRSDLFPSSWRLLGDQKAPVEEKNVRIKTLYGDVKFAVGKWWSTCASLDQLTAFALSQQARLPTEAEYRIYARENPTDTPAANIGFANLHQLPATLPKRQRDGAIKFASNGGVWEWTTSVLGPHDGYSSSRLYPGYSSDFHDDAHFKILGGSYLTPPRIAGRAEFVNWYQAPYPYVVCGARLVRG